MLKLLDKQQIKQLEAKYGKHNFCYQCGSPNIKEVTEPALKGNFYCLNCSSSDLDFAGL